MSLAILFWPCFWFEVMHLAMAWKREPLAETTSKSRNSFSSCLSVVTDHSYIEAFSWNQKDLFCLVSLAIWSTILLSNFWEKSYTTTTFKTSSPDEQKLSKNDSCFKLLFLFPRRQFPSSQWSPRSGPSRPAATCRRSARGSRRWSAEDGKTWSYYELFICSVLRSRIVRNWCNIYIYIIYIYIYYIQTVFSHFFIVFLDI